MRRRLALAFVLVAGISAGALAAGSYSLVRQARRSDSIDRAVEQGRHDLLLAAGAPFGRPAFDPDALLGSYARTGVRVALVVDGQPETSTAQTPPIPSAVRSLVERGDLAYERVGEAGSTFVVVGGRPPGTAAALYFFFSEDRLEHDLAVLRNVLLAGWAAIVAVAAAVGTLLARRVLAPVARASRAATAIAGGRLDTRLPADGHDEFSAWAESFNRMADALEAQIAALVDAQSRERRFTSDVAHELRTPLSALVGEASLLADRLDALPGDVRRVAELLVHDVSRLRRLVDDLLEISRLDAGIEPVRLETVDVGSLVDALAHSRGWGGLVDVAGDRLIIQSDRRRLERVLGNLVGNAVEHGGGSVSVRLARDAGGARVDVADRGRGMTPEQLDRVFDRFYKADPSRAGGGSGLGLAIARENARLLGGDLVAESAPGRGTSFRLVLPIEAADGRTVSTEPESIGKPPRR